MGTENRRIGLRGHTRSPGSIANAEHHDPSNSQRESSGIPGTIEQITNDANEHAVPDDAIIRVANDTAGAIYLWIGDAGDNPTVDATNGMCILPGTSEVVFCGVRPDSKKSVAYKLSAAAQVVEYTVD